MIARVEIAAAARAWLGTPWHHQQTLKGIGCDCAGLVRGVVIELGLMPPDLSAWPKAEAFIGYGRRPDGRSMRLACETYMQPIERSALQIGDVVLNGWRLEPPQHLGIIVEQRYGDWVLVHASPGGVIEERVIYERRYWRYVQGYRLPGVDA